MEVILKLKFQNNSNVLLVRTFTPAVITSALKVITFVPKVTTSTMKVTTSIKYQSPTEYAILP